MVRLKECRAKAICPMPPDFNSTMVRLKEEMGIVGFQDLGYFNSTMVRLKGLRVLI